MHDVQGSGPTEGLLDTLVEMRSVLQALRRSAHRLSDLSGTHEHKHHASRIMARVEAMEVELTSFRKAIQSQPRPRRADPA